MYLNDNPVCSIIKYFENSVTFFLWSRWGWGGGRGAEERGLVVGGLRSEI